MARATSPPTAPRPGRPADQALTPAILNAALEELARVGFEAMSLERVARRAGTAKTSLYRRWPSRDALVADALAMFLAEHGPAGPEGGADHGSLRADLLAYAHRLAQALSPERAAVLAGLLLAMRTNPAMGAIVRRQLVQEAQDAMDAIVSRAATRGELAHRQVPETVRQILPSMLFTRLLEGGASTPASTLSSIVDDVLMPLLTQARAPARRGARRRR
jgi:AcrR family transcriptional regulator